MVSEELDNVDKGILYLLQKNARRNTTEERLRNSVFPRVQSLIESTPLRSVASFSGIIRS